MMHSASLTTLLKNTNIEQLAKRLGVTQITSLVIMGAAFLLPSPVFASEEHLWQDVSDEANQGVQVTSVSQLSDVRPSDWAFQALQSLLERYGCIAGYPNSKFHGDRTLTRYEFAAGLNACLTKIDELTKSGMANLATHEDLATLQRLQSEFASELAALRGRVDALEVKPLN
jgi:hypothetical protein